MVTTSSWMTARTKRLQPRLLEKGIHKDQGPPYHQHSPDRQTHGSASGDANEKLGNNANLERQDLAASEAGASEEDEPDD